MTAAVVAAEIGYRVFLVEKEPYLGGRVMRTYRYFPKMCPPTCGFEINSRRIRQNPRIVVHTQSTVEKLSGTAGDFKVRIRKRPRYVTGDCSLDDSVAERLTSKRPNDFNLGMDETKALYYPHDMAYPPLHVVDRGALSEGDAETLQEICPPGTIDLEMQEEVLDFSVGAVVVATGWQPYDATQIDNLGFGQYPNIITNMMMERLAAPNGPTKGKIVRPSDDKEPESVAFVQCAGSRDENHLPYCSYICCMASLKQATYVRERYPDAKIYVFYIDLRTPGNRYEKFYEKIKEDENIFLVKGKVAEVSEDPASKNVTVVAENAVTGEKIHQTVEMVVLATGMQPTAATEKLPADLTYNDDGFVVNNFESGGMFATGCANKPADVVSSNQNATGMALKAIQTLVNR